MTAPKLSTRAQAVRFGLQTACAVCCVVYALIGIPVWFMWFAVSDLLLGSVLHAYEAWKGLK